MPANENHSTETDADIAALEAQIAELTAKLNAARRAATGREVPDYSFRTLAGEARLGELFAGRDRLLAIHNMGQGCRYCTLWADGINGFLPHLESAMAVVLLSKDDPETQRRFANARGWRFRLASHGGGDYIREQTVMSGEDNARARSSTRNATARASARTRSSSGRAIASARPGTSSPSPATAPKTGRPSSPTGAGPPPSTTAETTSSSDPPGSGAGGEEVVDGALEVAEGIAHSRHMAVREVAEHLGVAGTPEGARLGIEPDDPLRPLVESFQR